MGLTEQDAWGPQGHPARKRGVVNEVIDELRRAQRKFGAMASPHEAYAVILEELDEFWAEVKSKEPQAPDRARDELVQVAAMALRAIDDCYGGDR